MRREDTLDFERVIFGPRATKSLIARQSELAPPSEQLSLLGGFELDFDQKLESVGWQALSPSVLEIFQINVGKLCNMTCRHCHVDAGPDRVDAVMSDEVVDACLAALDQTEAHTVDLTGGAPELHPRFRDLVEAAVARGKHVIDRCNLTILLTKPFQDLPEWLAERGVEVVCSLPHYAQRNTDAQRGSGTFQKSIEALKRLNSAGYGKGDASRMLTLMTNPAGAFISKNQRSMEHEWKRELKERYDVEFDRLFALNNMPIARYLEWLIESDNLEAYMERLTNAFNPATIDGLMCRNTLSISYDGFVYDCDFNQMLDMKVDASVEAPMHIRDFDLDLLMKRRIKTAPHCYGCTAGAGSSCGGATT